MITVFKTKIKPMNIYGRKIDDFVWIDFAILFILFYFRWNRIIIGNFEIHITKKSNAVFLLSSFGRLHFKNNHFSSDFLWHFRLKSPFWWFLCFLGCLPCLMFNIQKHLYFKMCACFEVILVEFVMIKVLSQRSSWAKFYFQKVYFYFAIVIGFVFT